MLNLLLFILLLGIIKWRTSSSSLSPLAVAYSKSVQLVNSPTNEFLKQLTLYTNASHVTVVLNGHQVYHISIDPFSSKLQIVEHEIVDKFDPNHFETSISSEGIFGVFNCRNEYFLAYVTKSIGISDIGIGVRMIKDIKLVRIPGLPYDNTNKRQSKHFISLLTETFNSHSFLYSTDSNNYDITRNAQSNLQYPHTYHAFEDYTKYCNLKFFWNYNQLLPLINAGMNMNLSFPVTNAWVSTKHITLNNTAYVLSLVSRRSKEHQGTRYGCYYDSTFPFTKIC
jgi:hypothetical protein